MAKFGLKNLRVVVALGQIAHQTYIRLLGMRPSEYPFRHGAAYRLPAKKAAELSAAPEHLVASYHPSRQNTNTGLLTMPMFLAMFRTAARLADLSVSL